MENNPLLQQIATMRQSLLDQGILDEQFVEIENLCDDEPTFAEDTVNLYFEETNKQLATIEEELAKNPINFIALESRFHDLKGSTASVGANKVKIEINIARGYCDQENIEGVKAAFEQFKRELETFKAKLDSYFELVKQVR